MQTDGWGKVKLELAGFYRAVEVRKVNELVAYIAAFCLVVHSVRQIVTWVSTGVGMLSMKMGLFVFWDS